MFSIPRDEFAVVEEPPPQLLHAPKKSKGLLANKEKEAAKAAAAAAEAAAAAALQTVVRVKALDGLTVRLAVSQVRHARGRGQGLASAGLLLGAAATRRCCLDLEKLS